MSKDLKIGRIEELQLVTRSGTVLANQTWSQTHVHGHSSGSSQYVGPQGGHIDLPSVQVSSTSSDRVRLFVRDDEGREFEASFTNPGVGVREGNRVSIVYSGSQAASPEELVSEDRRIAALVNHSTGKSRVYEGRARALASPGGFSITGLIGLVLVLAGVPLFIASIYFGFKWEIGILNWFLFWGLYIAAMMATGFLQSSKTGGLAREITAAVRQHVESLPG